jgi:hypothetical protein
MVIETSGFAHRLTSAKAHWFGEERSLSERDVVEDSLPERPIVIERSTQ